MRVAQRLRRGRGTINLSRDLPFCHAVDDEGIDANGQGDLIQFFHDRNGIHDHAQNQSWQQHRPLGGVA